MKLVTKITYEQLYVVFVTNFYDIPLEGLCMWKGKLERFEIDDYEEATYKVVHVNAFQRIAERIRKKMFEWCVGYHWTYDNGRRTRYYYQWQPVWLHNALFKLYYWLSK